VWQLLSVPTSQLPWSSFATNAKEDQVAGLVRELHCVTVCCWLFICSMLCSIWHVHTCPDSVCSTPGCRHLQLANQCQLVFFHVVLAVGSWLGWCCSKILSLSQLQIWNFQQATSASSVWISGRMCGTETPCYLSHCWYCYTQKTLLPVWLSTSE